MAFPAAEVSCKLQWPFPMPGLCSELFLYCSETAACCRALSHGFETAAWPPKTSAPFPPSPAASRGLSSFFLQTPVAFRAVGALRRAAAPSSFLRFRERAWPPQNLRTLPPLPCSVPWPFRAFSCKRQWLFELSGLCTELFLPVPKLPPAHPPAASTCLKLRHSRLAPPPQTSAPVPPFPPPKVRTRNTKSSRTLHTPTGDGTSSSHFGRCKANMAQKRGRRHQGASPFYYLRIWCNPYTVIYLSKMFDFPSSLFLELAVFGAWQSILGHKQHSNIFDQGHIGSRELHQVLQHNGATRINRIIEFLGSG